MKGDLDYVYGVSSFHRSGSSMMMRCLQFGGLPVVYDDMYDRIWWFEEGSDTYNANPYGYFHPDHFNTDRPHFYPMYQGSALKIPRAEFERLPPGAYKIIFMVRDPEEILASMRASTPYRSWANLEVKVYFYDLIKNASIANARKRGDTEVLEINYADVIKDPVGEMKKIKAFGFPIDPEKAAKAVDPSLYRNKITV